jgi:hypothetical protein
MYVLGFKYVPMWKSGTERQVRSKRWLLKHDKIKVLVQLWLEPEANIWFGFAGRHGIERQYSALDNFFILMLYMHVQWYKESHIMMYYCCGQVIYTITSCWCCLCWSDSIANCEMKWADWPTGCAWLAWIPGILIGKFPPFYSCLDSILEMVLESYVRMIQIRVGLSPP